MGYKIGVGVEFRQHLEDCKNNEPKSDWMISEAEEYSLDMHVYPVYLDDDDIDDDEFERIEEEVLAADPGYFNLLSSDQIEDIIVNLSQQKPDYTEQELISAINHYDDNDAFIVLK